MPQKYRRLLVFMLALLFFIAAPLLILYTAGYRYNIQTRQIQRTGILSIDTQPQGASIYIDNTLVNEQTDVVIANIIPGNYEVRIEKDGYYPWKKRLDVNANLSTFVKELQLFKESEPEELDFVQSDALYFSTDTDSFLSIDDQGSVYVVVPGTEEINIYDTDLTLLDTKVLDTYWYANSIFIHTNENKTYWLKRDNTDLYEQKDVLDVSDIQIDPSTGHVFIAHENGLSEVSPDFQETLSTIVPSGKILDMKLVGNRLYTLEAEEQRTTLYFRDISNLSSAKGIHTFSRSGAYSFVGVFGKYILIQDSSTYQLSIIEPGEDILRTQSVTLYDVEYIEKLNDDRIIAWDRNEITTIEIGRYFETDGSEGYDSIYKTSKSISQVEWLWNPSWILFIQDGSVFAIETDLRDKRNIIPLLHDDTDIIHFGTLGDEKHIYSIRSDESGNSLLRLNITD